MANSFALLLPVIPPCAGTQRTVTLLSLLRIREQTSMATTAKRWLEPMVFVLTLLIAAVESEKIVYLQPLSYRLSSVQSVWYMA